MFGVPATIEQTFNIYHDESGTYAGPGKGDRWLLHGVLLVPLSKRLEVFAALQEVREETNYWEEVHYKKIRHASYGPKALCARKWLHLYSVSLSGFCYYHCLAVDTQSPHFQHHRFTQPYHAYNRFARMAVEGAIAWSLKRYHKVTLQFFSDEKSRSADDNFAIYLPKQVAKSINTKRSQKPARYPLIELLYPQVIEVNSDPKKVSSELLPDSELVQLVDLLTSNIAQALTGRSTQEAKIQLSEIVSQWVQDTNKPPWLQTLDLYRRFSVSYFPDNHGGFGKPVTNTIPKGQGRLEKF